MKINYISFLVSKDVYKHLYKGTFKPGMQAQKFNRLVEEGLIKDGHDVTCYSNIPVSKQLIKETFKTVENDQNFIYSKIINIPGIKDIYVFISTYFKIKKDLKKNPNAVCVCDVLSVTNAYAASIACKKMKKACVGIVTDVPRFIMQEGLFSKLCYKCINNCTHYVFLSQPMNDEINKEGKPYVIIEGFADAETIVVDNTNRNKVIMYAGSIDKANGIDNLVKGFAGLQTDYQLHIYGTGDYEDELKQIIKASDNIKYFGLVDNELILQNQHQVSFLINPRPTENEFTKYSFPSKNMEYLSSGTPFICTKLECIPPEYNKYINYISGNGSAGITSTLKTLLAADYTALLAKAKEGQQFVLANKNNQIQAHKIIKMVMEKEV